MSQVEKITTRTGGAALQSATAANSLPPAKLRPVMRTVVRTLIPCWLAWTPRMKPSGRHPQMSGSPRTKPRNISEATEEWVMVRVFGRKAVESVRCRNGKSTVRDFQNPRIGAAKSEIVLRIGSGTLARRSCANSTRASFPSFGRHDSQDGRGLLQAGGPFGFEQFYPRIYTGSSGK